MSDLITIAEGSSACNKRIIQLPDKLIKDIAGTPHKGTLRTVAVPDVQAMAEIQQEIATDPKKFLINGYVKGSTDGDTFNFLSKDKLEKRTGRPYEHQPVDIDGALIVARMKQTFAPSSWWQLDRDHAPGMPEQLNVEGDEEYIAMVDQFIPGMAAAGHVKVPSTTGRVLVDGEPMNATGCRYWFQVENAEDMDGFRDRALCSAVKVDLSFGKPNKNGNETPWTIFDPSVFTPERCIYDGQPTLAGFTLSLRDPELVIKEGGRVDTSLVPMPDLQTREKVRKKHGLKVSRHGKVVSYVSEGVYLDFGMVIEVMINGRRSTMSVRQFFESSHDRLRCQATFRDSDSWNGALKKDRTNGLPYLQDFGTGTRYHLSPAAQIQELRENLGFGGAR